ncbi:MAG: diguanylate cyclase [Kosmotogaceae bacterium]|nr:diguanylate cyclase [Kosmotogaceae bacterium]
MESDSRNLFCSVRRIISVLVGNEKSLEKIKKALSIVGDSLSVNRLTLCTVEGAHHGSSFLKMVCDWRKESDSVMCVCGSRTGDSRKSELEKLMRKSRANTVSEAGKGILLIKSPPGLPDCVLILEIDLHERNLSVEEKDFVKCAIRLMALMTGEEYNEETGNSEKSLLQERLLRSDELLKNFEGNVLDILAVVDGGLIFTYVSPSVVNTLGFVPEELVGKNALDLVDFRDRERVIEESKVLLREKKHGCFRYRARTKSGGILWMETAVSPLFNGKEVEGWTMSSRDVTGEMKLQAELKARDSMMVFMNDLYVLILSGDNLHEAASKIVNRAYEEKGMVACKITFSEDEYLDLEVSRGDTEAFPLNLMKDSKAQETLRENRIIVQNIIIEGKELRYICIALESNNEIAGSFETLTERVTGLTEESMNLYRLVGTTVSLSLTKIRNLVSTRRNHITSQSLIKATEAITKDLNMRTVIESIVGGLRQVIPFYSAAVELVEGDHLVIVGGSWPGKDSFVGTKFTMEEGSPGFDVVKSKKIILAEDAQRAYQQFNKPDFIFIKSWMGVPLVIGDETIGMIAVDSEEGGKFKKRHLDALKAFADIAAIGINNARLHEEVRDLSVRDYLTGAYNRRGLFELGECEIEKAKRYDTKMGLIMFDIDNFKNMNDMLGHLAGDFVLKRVANICTKILRAADIFARYGGDEFIILLPMTDITNTEEAATRICRSLEDSRIVYKGIPIKVRASLGIASLEGHGDELEDMIRRADRNLYVSKRSGGNKVTGGRNYG